MEDSVVGRSVGRAYSVASNLSSIHPLYQAISGHIESRVAELAAERGANHVRAPLSFSTVALDSDELTLVTDLYPEFRIVQFPMHKPAHALFVQQRRLAAEWAFSQACKAAPSSVFVCGLPLVSALQVELDVVMYADPRSVVSAHERHSVNLDAYKIFSDVASVSKEVGRLVSRGPYDDFIAGQGQRITSNPEGVVADALCVDGLLVDYSPMQVAVIMGITGASVAFGTVPYHHTMLLNDQGELPGSGVYYARTDSEVVFKYPEGVAGVTSYGFDSWRAWLVAHTFSVGTGRRARWYQLELLKERGCVLFYRLVCVPSPPSSTSLVHALELESARGKYLVTSMRLKGVSADPLDPSSWSQHRYLVGKRLVDRVYQFAMTLPREQFTKYALRKQLHAVNDRVVIEGTTVVVNSALGLEVVDALVVDVYGRAFVDRYDAGELTSSAKRYVDEQVAFSAYSRLEKLWYITTACTVASWEWTVGPMNHWVRQAADYVRRKLGSVAFISAPEIRVAPSYLLVGGAGVADLKGGVNVAREIDRRAAMDCHGLFAHVVRACALAAEPVVAAGQRAFRVETFAAFATPPAAGAAVEEVVDLVKGLNPVDESPYARRALEIVTAVRKADSGVREHFNPVADPVQVLNEFHSAAFPGVAEQNLEHDTASLSLDPQDRTLMASYLRLPKYFGDAPKPRAYFKSRLRALGTPKRQQTLQELLSAVSARNLNAPQVALPQDNRETARLVWENFLDKACIAEARDILKSYAVDEVSLEEGAFKEWVAQSTPAKLEAVRKELAEQSQTLEEMPVGEYLAQLKADYKPTLSNKPLNLRTEPQVIVYHEKALSALYSSIFRVLVRRFLALLKPNYHVNLLKDTKDIEAFVRGVHPYGEQQLQYLENDFSKYDKSQAEFVFVLEQFVFAALGMNRQLLRKWVAGHVDCSIRALGMGMSLHVMYQRKSGDATTSFGNVLLNVLSVTYAYASADIVWAVFMGDDSLACARSVGFEERAVAILAEVFNLGAKFYVTGSPYFASNFVLIDDFCRIISFVPDPVKRVERWSMSVSADDPQWQERYVSAGDSLSVYLSCARTAGMQRALRERYQLAATWTGAVCDSVATLVSDPKKFRQIWEDVPEMSIY